jgi:adenylosuccinate synthase
VALRYSVQLNGCDGLACTGLSVLASLPRIKVCVAYEFDGTRLDTVPSDSALLERIVPVYEELEAFPSLLTDMRSYSDLPAQVHQYLRYVEQFVGVPVQYACVGRRRDQILVRNDDA